MVDPTDFSRYGSVAKFVKQTGFLDYLTDLAVESLTDEWRTAETVERREQLHAALDGLEEIKYHFNSFIEQLGVEK